MRFNITILFMLFAWNGTSQDTLREQYSNGFDRYFILFEDNSFELHDNYGEGEDIGFGQYKMKKSKILFEYVEIPEPETVIIESDSSYYGDVMFQLYDITNNTIIDYFDLTTNNEKWTAIEGVIAVPKDKIITDSVTIKYYEEDIKVPISEHSNRYEIYIFPINKSYRVDQVISMKRKGNMFYEKYKAYDLSELEGFRRKKRQRIVYVFQLN